VRGPRIVSRPPVRRDALRPVGGDGRRLSVAGARRCHDLFDLKPFPL